MYSRAPRPHTSQSCALTRSPWHSLQSQTWLECIHCCNGVDNRHVPCEVSSDLPWNERVAIRSFIVCHQQPLRFFDRWNVGTNQDVVYQIGIEWWRARRPDTCLHDKEWLPLASTSSPHTQSWGSPILHPNLRPTAILIASLSRRSPHEEIEIASNQSPLWGADVARSLALVYESSAFIHSIFLPALTLAMSHARCLLASEPSGCSASYLACQIERVSLTAVSECPWAGVTGKFVRNTIEDWSS